MDWRRHLAPDEVAGARVWRGEQSNTTIVVGAGLFKLFRRVEPGPNLDAEVLTALDGTSAATPALWGRLTGPWPSGQTTDLGMVIERVPDVTDGWELASAACAAGEDFTERAEELGRALRRVHRELADAFGTTTRPGDENPRRPTRLDHHRLRGRAGEDGRRAARTRLGVARCGRDDAVVRLRSVGPFRPLLGRGEELGRSLPSRLLLGILWAEGFPRRPAVCLRGRQGRLRSGV
jgi:hypothetical protein